MNGTILEKTAQIKRRYEELSAQIADASVIAQQSKWQQLMREHASLAPLLPVVSALEKAQADIQEAQELLDTESDAQLCALARMQMKEAQETLAQQYEQLQRLLLPRDPNDDRDVIVEIRAGVGGEEAALFAGDLLRMYTRYAERVGWKSELLSVQDTGVGGVKVAVLQISGRGAYSRLKFESVSIAYSACRQRSLRGASILRRRQSPFCRRRRMSRFRSMPRIFALIPIAPAAPVASM